MSGARQGWNAAQRASERELKKPRKMLEPVGKLAWQPPHPAGREACNACGFTIHAPTCWTQRPTLKQFPVPEQLEAQRAPLEANRLLTPNEAAAACREGGKTARLVINRLGDRVITTYTQFLRWNADVKTFEYTHGVALREGVIWNPRNPPVAGRSRWEIVS